MKHTLTPGAIQRIAYPTRLQSLDDANRRITFLSSTECEDRYGDIIRVDGWDTTNYQKNPVFLWAHDSSQPPVGKGMAITKQLMPVKALVQEIQFADVDTYAFADTVYRLYKGGFLSAVSVGFIPKTYQPRLEQTDNGLEFMGYEFLSQELLELSAVPVPANPEALGKMLKGANQNGVLQYGKLVDAMLLTASEKGVLTSDQAEQAGKLFRASVPSMPVTLSIPGLGASIEVTPEVKREGNVIRVSFGLTVEEARGVEMTKEEQDAAAKAAAEAVKKDPQDGDGLSPEDQAKVDAVSGKKDPVDGDDGDYEEGMSMEQKMDKLHGKVDRAHKKLNEARDAHNEQSQTLAEHTKALASLQKSMDMVCSMLEKGVKPTTEPDGGDADDDNDGDKAAKPAVTRSVVPFHKEKLAPKDDKWDASAEMKDATKPEEWKRMSTVIVGDADNKGSYKLPHHKGPSGDFATVFKGVVAGLGRLEQTDMPSDERDGARSHLTKHQDEFEGKAFSGEVLEQALKGLGDSYRAAVTAGNADHAKELDASIVSLVEAAFGGIKFVAGETTAAEVTPEVTAPDTKADEVISTVDQLLAKLVKQ